MNLTCHAPLRKTPEQNVQELWLQPKRLGGRSSSSWAGSVRLGGVPLGAAFRSGRGGKHLLGPFAKCPQAPAPRRPGSRASAQGTVQAVELGH